MNSFERHNIKHLSASSLNLWSAMPGLWALRYLCGFRDTAGPAASRGNAVESGFTHILRGHRDTAQKAALLSFDEAIQGEISEGITIERARIPGMLTQCAAWKPPGELLAAQIKVELWLDDIPVPIIGYVDFSFEGKDVDLKTTKACPSAPKGDHVRQASIYRTARKKLGSLLYVTEKKHAELEVTDEMRDAAIEELRLTAKSLDRFLDRSESGEAALRCLPIDRDNFRWSQMAEREYRDVLAGRGGALSAADMRFLADHGISLGFEAVQIADR